MAKPRIVGAALAANIPERFARSFGVLLRLNAISRRP